MAGKPRARDLGAPFPGEPGKYNAITDVPGVQVGHCTIIEGEGEHQVRTGVTAILPLPRTSPAGCAAATFALNGNGEMTGTAFIEEFGLLFGPIMITNTHSVGAVHEATVKYIQSHGAPLPWSMPVVAETFDGKLNDPNGFAVREEHVFKALDSARSGEIEMGAVGGGTGMIAFGFKGGIGSSSRLVEEHYVGVLVQANHGARRNLTICGRNVGRELEKHEEERPSSSIIVVVATDAPLLPGQLRALCKRAALGIGRTGGFGEMTSGDLLIAFSTGNQVEKFREDYEMRSVGANKWNALFQAAAEATEEAIIEALVAAEPMKARDGSLIDIFPPNALKG